MSIQIADKCFSKLSVNVTRPNGPNNDRKSLLFSDGVTTCQVPPQVADWITQRARAGLGRRAKDALAHRAR
jgi:hypothetical protein